jgi:hypothetical protein
MHELQNFGWNKLTILFFVTIGFNIAAMVAVYHQIQKVTQENRGDGVAVFSNQYHLMIHGMNFVYGWKYGSLALLVNGLMRGLLHIWLVRRLAYCRNFTPIENLVGRLLVAFLAIATLSTNTAQFAFWANMGSIIILVQQPIEFVSLGKTGAFHAGPYWVYTFSVMTWLAYGVWVHDWLMLRTAPAFLGIFVITLGVYYYYRTKPAS